MSGKMAKRNFSSEELLRAYALGNLDGTVLLTGKQRQEAQKLAGELNRIHNYTLLYERTEAVRAYDLLIARDWDPKRVEPVSYLECEGPGMHRLHDEGDNVAPCPCCGRHHFGPGNQIEDSSVDVYYGKPTLYRLLMRWICSRCQHDWQLPKPYHCGHVQRCNRCDATRMTVPVNVGEVKP